MPNTTAPPSSIHVEGEVRFDYLNPREEDVDIENIFRSLSRTPRFRGFTARFYSVLEHSYKGAVAMSRVSPEHTLEFLLHDAHEAYVGDMPTPLKILLPEYKAIEDKVDAVIRRKYGLPEEMSPEVKAMDMAMCVSEKLALKPDAGHWAMLDGIKPANVEISADPFLDISRPDLKSLAARLFMELTQ